MIGILEAGAPPDGLIIEPESYASMFRELLGPKVSTQTFDIVNGGLPDPQQCSGWLITGSTSAAYEEISWIVGLAHFLRNIPESVPVVGICFGHQVMARAHGGKVAKSPKGRALGLHRYNIWRPASWMDSSDPIDLPVGHQDQVVAVGPDCVVHGGSEFTPFGILSYSGRRAFSIQSHPEYTVEFARALLKLRGKDFGAEAAEDAEASLDQPNDCARVAQWLLRFLSA